MDTLSLNHYELRAELSSPDALTPAQYYPAPEASPYERLLFAILEDAIRCFQHNCTATKGPRRTLFRESEEWLFDSHGTAFLSCAMVCESVGINPVALRRYLREWRLAVKAGSTAPRLERRRSILGDHHVTSPDAYYPARALADPSKK
jgi:hypothetical protein